MVDYVTSIFKNLKSVTSKKNYKTKLEQTKTKIPNNISLLSQRNYDVSNWNLKKN
jgi:hypothetical protein